MSETVPEPDAPTVEPPGEVPETSDAPEAPAAPLEVPEGSVAIRLTTGLNIAGDHHSVDDVVVVPAEVAESVLVLGYAVLEP